MKYKSFVAPALIFISAHSASFAIAHSMDGNMPALLLSDASSRGCKPIFNFYARDGITLPPFLFDYQGGNIEYSSAYVCERDNYYYLIFPPVPTGVCKQREILLGDAMPGGLKTASKLLKLSIFSSLDNSQKPIGRAASKTSIRPLSVEYDGVERIIYCHSGMWLGATLD